MRTYVFGKGDGGGGTYFNTYGVEGGTKMKYWDTKTGGEMGGV